MKPTLPWLLFIRACIISLHWITPLSVAICTFQLFYPRQLYLPIALQSWLIAETVFYIVVYFPLRRYLQRPAIHPELGTREERRTLFDRCTNTIPDPERYIHKWFMDSPSSDIKRENVKEFLWWAFLSSAQPNEAHEEEVEEYTLKTEHMLGRSFEPGRGKAKCLRLTVDEVKMYHRSLFWYFCIFVVDSLTSLQLAYHKFEYRRTPLRSFFSVFPFRPHNLSAKQKSPSDILTYWHRKHTSKTKLPILFIHGIGIGLWPYVDFLAEINGKADVDETVGIIAIEIMPVSFRITAQALQKSKMCKEIDKILEAHGWDKLVLVSHSYGSVISTHLLHTPAVAKRIGPVLLIDPVTFMLHLPDVAYNFLCRVPQLPNEHRLDYFAAKDIGVAHTLSRTFFWSENIIWKEDWGNRPVTVVLSGRDLIVNTEHVGRYLTEPDESSREKGTWKYRNWVGKGLDLVWFEELDHAEVFERKETRAKLLDVLQAYCATKKNEEGVKIGEKRDIVGQSLENTHVDTSRIEN